MFKTPNFPILQIKKKNNQKIKHNWYHCVCKSFFLDHLRIIFFYQYIV